MTTVISLENYQAHTEIVEQLEDGDKNALDLHFLYFSCMASPTVLQSSSTFESEASRAQGSLNAFIDFLRLAAMKKSGWSIIGWDIKDGELCMHDSKGNDDMPLYFVPIIAIDMFEHAYWMDYGNNTQSYVDAFIASIDWSFVDKRLIQCKKVII